MLLLVPFVYVASASCNLNHECDAPKQPTYACNPLPPGAAGCPGVDDAGAHTMYPDGCKVTMTWCNAAYGNEPEVCICEVGRGAQAGSFACGL